MNKGECGGGKAFKSVVVEQAGGTGRGREREIMRERLTNREKEKDAD